MAPATAPPPNLIHALQPAPRRSHAKFLIPVAIVLVAAAIGVAALAASRYWPFAQSQVVQDLQEASDSKVEIRSFHGTYFPVPGCVLEGVVFHHQPGEAKPLITIQRLRVEGSYLGLVSQRVNRIVAEGMLISVPPFSTHTEFHTTPSKITIAEVVANGSAVEFASSDPHKKPLRFDVHEAILRGVGWSGPMSYHLKVHNPEPPGEVTTQGKFGLWNRTNAGETPISGEYRLEQADLGVYGGIGGTLSSSGKFEGKLAHIDIAGSTDTPDFEVSSSSHKVRLTSRFTAYVDATRGDTFLKQVDADFWKTHVVAQGSIAGSPGKKGKTAVIDLQSKDARIQDLLLLFVKSSRAPMSGSVALHARAEIPPGEQEFLKKIMLQGGFGIAGGTFGKPSTQEGVDKLSAGARGEKVKDDSDPETALTDLRGQVGVSSGVATFTDLSFNVPGAAARVHGTYGLIDYRVDLRGQMQVDSKISNTSSGAKAFLLKMMEPFFKKRRKGEIVPVRISGTYHHPTFGLDLNDKKAQKVPPPGP